MRILLLAYDFRKTEKMWVHNHINFSNIPLTHKKTLFCSPCRGVLRQAKVAQGVVEAPSSEVLKTALETVPSLL